MFLPHLTPPPLPATPRYTHYSIWFDAIRVQKKKQKMT